MIWLNPFLWMALLAGMIASIPAGIVGSYIVVKRIVFIAGSVAHSVLGGMGLFLYLQRVYGWEFLHPLYGALLFSVIAAWLIGIIHLKFKQREDTIIATMWALGMSVGVIFLSLTPGYNVEIITFLFGNILWTNSSDIALLGLLALIAISVCWYYHNSFKLVCFDETQSYIQGLPVMRLYFTLLTVIALSVVILIQVIGAILVIAMLCLPAATSNLFTRRLSTMMGLAVLIGFINTFLGMIISYTLNWPPGATMSLFSAGVYLITLLQVNKRVIKS